MFRRALYALALFSLASCGSDPVPTTPPTTTLAPTPAPTTPPANGQFVCPLKAMPDHGNCPAQPPVFTENVLAAINNVERLHPELFDFDDNLGGDAYAVKDRTKYLQEVAKDLNRQGFCVSESTEELGIKNTNAFNEQWNVITSKLHVRRSYVSTCNPAAF
jgi:hypothetical protein